MPFAQGVEAFKMVHDSTIAILGAFALFVIPSDFGKGTFLLDWSTAVKIPWNILLLFGGGLALANAFGNTGLAQWVAGKAVFLHGTDLLLIIFSVALITVFLTEVASNTATATMLIPILGSLAIALTVHPFALTVAVAVAASYAFMLPVATPPNAVVFGSKYVTIRQMVKAGLWLNLAGAVLITLAIRYILPGVWDVDLNLLPVWAVASG